MKKGYWVVAYRTIKDPALVQAYSKIAGPVIQAGGGKFIVRGSDTIEAFEAGVKQRTVVVEFESFEKALAVHNSDAYEAALNALGAGAERDFRIIEGVD